jgi:RNA polymerase sigma factor (sigma-70 family)
MPDYLKFSDTDLIARCLEKDAGAWEALIRRYQNLIISIAVKFKIPLEDSADIVQSVCLALLQQLPNLRKEAKLSSWLITVTVRECWKFRRRGERTGSLDEREWERVAESPDETQAGMEEQLLGIERRHLVRRAVESLAPPCRQLIEQLFYQDPPLTYAEISQRLSMPVASIGPIRGRCLGRLKEQLKKNGFN